MNARGRFGVALGTGVAMMAGLGVAVALSSHPVRPRILCAMPLGTGGYSVYFGYTNGWLGYMLTPKELPLGGYEPRVSPSTAQAAADLTATVLRLTATIN